MTDRPSQPEFTRIDIAHGAGATIDVRTTPAQDDGRWHRMLNWYIASGQVMRLYRRSKGATLLMSVLAYVVREAPSAIHHAPLGVIQSYTGLTPSRVYEAKDALLGFTPQLVEEPSPWHFRLFPGRDFAGRLTRTGPLGDSRFREEFLDIGKSFPLSRNDARGAEGALRAKPNQTKDKREELVRPGAREEGADGDSEVLSSGSVAWNGQLALPGIPDRRADAWSALQECGVREPLRGQLADLANTTGPAVLAEFRSIRAEGGVLNPGGVLAYRVAGWSGVKLSKSQVPRMDPEMAESMKAIQRIRDNQFTRPGERGRG